MAYLKRVGNGSCNVMYTTPLPTRLSIPLSFIFYANHGWGEFPSCGGDATADGEGLSHRDKRIIVCDALDSRLRGNDGVGVSSPLWRGGRRPGWFCCSFVFPCVLPPFVIPAQAGIGSMKFMMFFREPSPSY